MMVGRSNSNVRTIQFRDQNGKVTGTMTVSKSTQAAQKKLKKLFYNFKAISAKILGAKTSGTARMALVSAKNKTASLRRKLRTGEYDDAEIEIAIRHARQMERIAKKRQRHLQQEEQAGKTGKQEEMLKWEEELSDDMDEQAAVDVSEISEEELEKLMQEMKKLMDESYDSMMEELDMEDLSDDMLAAGEELDPEDLKLLKKKHRSDELREIAEADMKYLKAMFQKYEREKAAVSSSISSTSGNNAAGAGGGMGSSAASLEIAGEVMPAGTCLSEAAAMVEGSMMDISV